MIRQAYSLNNSTINADRGRSKVKIRVQRYATRVINAS